MDSGFMVGLVEACPGLAGPVGCAAGAGDGLATLQLVNFGWSAVAKTGTGSPRSFTEPHCDCAAPLSSM
jgi:hypothetical protein